MLLCDFSVKQKKAKDTVFYYSNNFFQVFHFSGQEVHLSQFRGVLLNFVRSTQSKPQLTKSGPIQFKNERILEVSLHTYYLTTKIYCY